MITPNSIATMYRGDTHNQNVVQVVHSRKMTNNNTTRYALEISDGTHKMKAMVATQLNHLFEESPDGELIGQLRLHSVVRLNNAICNVVQARKVMIILELDVLGWQPMIGSPVPIGEKSSDPQVASLMQQIGSLKRQLAAVAASREAVPTSMESTAVTLPTAQPGRLAWLPGASRLARWLDVRFLTRVAHLLEVDVKLPSTLATVLNLAAHARAMFLPDARGALPPATRSRDPHAAAHRCPLNRLSADVIVVLASHVSDDAQLAVALSCKAMRDAIYIAITRKRLLPPSSGSSGGGGGGGRDLGEPGERVGVARPRSASPKPTPLMRTTVSSAVLAGGSYLAWAHGACGCPLTAIRIAAARHGVIRVIEWAGAQDHGHEWDETCAVEAAHAGQLRLLEWAANRGHTLLIEGFEESIQEGARAHAQRLFRLLGMSRYRMVGRDESPALAYGPLSGVDVAHLTDGALDDLVRTFFMGAQLLDDTELYGVAGVLARVRVGAGVQALRASVSRLVAAGRLHEVVSDGGVRRYRPLFGAADPEPTLQVIVVRFFTFGEDEERGYSVGDLMEWAAGLGASEAELQDVIEELVDQGHMYGLVDLGHYKAT